MIAAYDSLTITLYADDTFDYHWEGSTGQALVSRDLFDHIIKQLQETRDGLAFGRRTEKRLTAERDRARDTAVRLEQELAHLTEIVVNLKADLFVMHRDEAIDLQLWPAAKALTDWRPRP